VTSSPLVDIYEGRFVQVALGRKLVLQGRSVVSHRVVTPRGMIPSVLLDRFGASHLFGLLCCDSVSGVRFFAQFVFCTGNSAPASAGARVCEKLVSSIG
jgi:hypothetical protein